VIIELKKACFAKMFETRFGFAYVQTPNIFTLHFALFLTLKHHNVVYHLYCTLSRWR